MQLAPITPGMDWNAVLSQYTSPQNVQGLPAIDRSGFQAQMAQYGQTGVPVGGGGSWTDWLKDGNNLGTVVQGIGTLAQGWLGYQQLQAAKDQLKFSKEAFNANLGNSIKSYNTSLEDRIRGRTSDYAGKENDVEQYLDRHRLSR